MAVPSAANPSDWPSLALGPATRYPVTDLGASLDSPGTAAARIPLDASSVAGFLAKHANGPTEHLLQVRLVSGTSGRPTHYWSVELAVDPATGSWQTVTGSGLARAAVRSSQMTLGAVSIEAQRSGQPMVIQAQVWTADGDRAAGTARLTDGETDLGPASYDLTTGMVRAAIAPVEGTHEYRLRLTPTGGGEVGSGLAAVTFHNGKPAPTPVGLTVMAQPPAGDLAYGSTTLAAVLTPSGAVGTVTFTDSKQGKLGIARVSKGRASLVTNALGAGRHVITARYTPTACTPYRAATATTSAFTLTVAKPASAGSPVRVTVDSGQLTITTPYTAEHPFDLGDLVLAADGSRLIATAHFGSTADAATKGVTVTDTRSADLPWTASLSSSDFVSGTNSISAQNLGFIGIRPLAVPGGSLGTTAKPVTPHDLPASAIVKAAGSSGNLGLSGAPKTFATAEHGAGSVYLYGDLVLDAPTVTPSGLYTATLTFTVG